MKVFTQTRFAKEMGFPSAGDKMFHRFLKKAIKRGIVKVQQSGFRADSMHHPKLVIQLKDFNPELLINRVGGIPSWQQGRDVNGYTFIYKRTGIKRKLKTGKYSTHKWYRCEDCGRKIPIGKPYASKVSYSNQKRKNKKKGHRPVFCKCVSCYLKLLEEWDIAHLS
jgi:hypothetical protein